MPQNNFGDDPIDIYSSPVEIQKTKLSKLFILQPRETKEKPGRKLSVVWDARKPLVPRFANNYSYYVTFKTKGNIAGNHYHKKKEELFYAVNGELTVFLEDGHTKMKEEIRLLSTKHQALFIPKNISHMVRADTDNAILLVIATASGVTSDEFKYKI